MADIDKEGAYHEDLREIVVAMGLDNHVNVMQIGIMKHNSIYFEIKYNELLKMTATQSTTIKRTRVYSNILSRIAKITMTKKHFN